MLSIPTSVRIFLASEAVDFRKGFDGLCALVRDGFGDDPLSGHLFLFFNRRRDRIKILLWDRNGFWIFYKRLERGTFAPLRAVAIDARRVEIDRVRLQLILDGVETSALWWRKDFALPMTLSKRHERGDEDRRDSRGHSGAESGAR